MVTVRSEMQSDIPAIRAVQLATFPTRAEADLVDALRATEQLSVSLIAERDREILGHVAFSPITLNGQDSKGIALGPMAVSPAFQRQSVGTALLRAGLQTCTTGGFGFMVVLGHPAYYERFGFVRGSRFGFENEYGVDEAFMVRELAPDGLPASGGLVQYAGAFSTLTA